jgi:hypothetical protein
MANKQPKNKIGESFEQHLPDESVPDFIWNNISNTLDNSKIPAESTKKIKASFEDGFEEDALSPLLWNGIQSSLDQSSTLSSSTEPNNKIKTSFEAGHQDLLPEDLWENVENKLEIEGVWQRVRKGLNKRAKRRYWQEKGIQFSILVMAILSLRGCDLGEGQSSSPIANQSSTSAKVNLQLQQPSPVSTTNSNPATANTTGSKAIPTSTSSKNNLLEQPYAFNSNNNTFSEFLKPPYLTNSIATSPIFATNTTTNPTFVETKLEQQYVNHKENSNSTKNNATLDNAPIAYNKEGNTSNNYQTNTTGQNKASSTSNKANNTAPAEVLPTKAVANNNSNNSIIQNTLASKSATSSNKPLDKTTTTLKPSQELLSQTAISILTGQVFIDSTIDQLYAFQIHNVENKKKHNIRFELGVNGKVGTSLLLGNTTNRAMETTSMVKTKIRAAGGIGILFDCYLTANDAIVFGAYPLSNSQQYFGGYTNEGRYYHKEVKLAYFDFTLGYQRTLFHYNDFGRVPSSIYARLDYGLGYLSKSEEIINGLAAELGDSYKKINHNIGLTIGNTHRINRFVIDYGIYSNIGLSSVLNISSSGSNSVEYSNLATMGGYIGLRYML